jgi:glycosyltransferase involved in cell wall biosynthesis
MKTNISICIIAFNEEKIIAKCLEKVTWADEIIVVDSGSTDATISICESFGAKVIYHTKTICFVTNQKRLGFIIRCG